MFELPNDREATDMLPKRHTHPALSTEVGIMMVTSIPPNAGPMEGDILVGVIVRCLRTRPLGAHADNKPSVCTQKVVLPELDAAGIMQRRLDEERYSASTTTFTPIRHCHAPDAVNSPETWTKVVVSGGT